MKNKGLFYTAILILSFIPQLALSQVEFPFKGELDLKFEKSEKSRIEKSLKTIELANKYLAEANAMFEILDDKDKNIKKDEKPSPALKKTLKKILETADTYENAYTDLIRVYKEKCNNFWEYQKEINHRATGLEKAKYYERLANKYLGRGQTKRKQSELYNDYSKVYSLTLEANNYELQALQSQGRALQIYQDYPVEYDYNWENDIDIEKILAENKKVIVEEPQIPKKDTIIPEIIIIDTVIDKSKDKDTVVVFIRDTVYIVLKDTLDSPDTTIILKDTPDYPDTIIILKDTLNYLDSTFTFRVQIAAHTTPLTEEYLRTIYKGRRNIFMLQEEGWYKYSIGVFSDYYEAESVVEKSNVEKAFIAVYQFGKKITLTEALEQLGIKPPE